jgi:tRNA U34 5-methylaminomethyl-2-thiouridine-forming methyltransferase MnmC
MDDRPIKASLALNQNLGEEAISSTFTKEQSDRVEILTALQEHGRFSNENTELKLMLGDARGTINEVKDEFDAIFLDPFTHEVNPELWSFDFIRKISAKLAENGVMVTYSAAFPIRGAMTRCGLFVGETPAVGRRKGGTIASFEEAAIIAPLNTKTMRIIRETTTGAAYRDPLANWSSDKIRETRAALIKRLSSKGILKWLK